MKVHKITLAEYNAAQNDLDEVLTMCKMLQLHDLFIATNTQRVKLFLEFWNR